ncbi:hypothetical protein [Actinokineospora sp.]|uniref:hypothetical protein n=1 Tax=Actinokineospora sp. TaxID=1872133 RepID=UPI0040381E37
MNGRVDAEFTLARIDAGVDPVARWQLRLAQRIGMGQAERNLLRAGLDQYCAGHQVSPEELLANWLDHPELTVRRRPGSTEQPNLAVESFLIHNGVNVFGEIVCVAGARPEDLAAQGSWFTRGRET